MSRKMVKIVLLVAVVLSVIFSVDATNGFGNGGNRETNGQG